MISQTLPKAWLAFTSNKKYLILTILFEFLFLFAVINSFFSFFIPTAEAFDKVNQAMQEQMADLQESELYELEGRLLTDDEFMVAYHSLFVMIVLFIVSVFVSWLVFRTPVWYLSLKSILKKMPLKTVIKKFVLLNLFWFVLLILSFGLYSLATGSTTTIIPVVSSSGASLVFIALFLVISYFSSISFALIPAQHTFRKTFIEGVKHAKVIIPAFLFNALIVFIVCTLPFNWIQTRPLLSLAIILFISIPSLAFARLHIIAAVWLKLKA